MTSDAKIGLLLGLVCIFIIAFIINGLPRFRNVVSSNELTTTMNDIAGTQNGAVGIGNNERNAPGVFDRETPEIEEALDAVAQDNTDYAPQWLNNPFSTEDNLDEEVYYNNDFQENYFEQPYDETLAFDENQQDAFLSDSPTYQEEVRYQLQFPFVSATEEVSIDQTVNETVQPAQTPQQNQSIQSTPQPAQSAAQTKKYTIQEGDGNLANIAKKFYGEREGNRIVNVNRIFEANKNILKSADEIFVGQTLVIPPLPDAPAGNTQPDDIFGSGLFERVRSIGGRAETGRWYEVKENDSLWKIAEEQLGDGSRYKEISKLNADILTDENELKLGMRLLLPAQ